MTATTLELGRQATAARLAELISEARLIIGWTQRELADRAGTSQATLSRLESGRATTLDLATIERVLGALGMRASLSIEGRHLADRQRQLDAVHARLTGHVARRLECCGWRTATEVLLGHGAPRGWIDLLAFRPSDRALLVEETKTDIPDMGALQRSLAFYEREASAAARRLGWHHRTVSVLVVALDSATIADRLRANREIVVRAFPAATDGVAAWLADPHQPTPQGWALGTCDPRGRGPRWLRPTTLGTRRRPPAYADYADAAVQLRRS